MYKRTTQQHHKNNRIWMLLTQIIARVYSICQDEPDEGDEVIH